MYVPLVGWWRRTGPRESKGAPAGIPALSQMENVADTPVVAFVVVVAVVVVVVVVVDDDDYMA